MYFTVTVDFLLNLFQIISKVYKNRQSKKRKKKIMNGLKDKVSYRPEPLNEILLLRENPKTFVYK